MFCNFFFIKVLLTTETHASNITEDNLYKLMHHQGIILTCNPSTDQLARLRGVAAIFCPRTVRAPGRSRVPATHQTISTNQSFCSQDSPRVVQFISNTLYNHARVEFLHWRGFMGWSCPHLWRRWKKICFWRILGIPPRDRISQRIYYNITHDSVFLSIGSFTSHRSVFSNSEQCFCIIWLPVYFLLCNEIIRNETSYVGRGKETENRPSKPPKPIKFQKVPAWHCDLAWLVLILWQL